MEISPNTKFGVMKTLIILLIFSFLYPVSTNAQKKTKIKGDREVISTSGEVKEPFNSIKISNNIQLEIENASRNSYVLTTDQNLMEEVEIIVRDNTLEIFTKSKITNSKKLHLFLKVKDLNFLTLNDEARIKNRGKFRTNEIKITANNSSRLDLDLEITENADLSLLDNAGGKIAISADIISLIMKDRTDLKGNLDCKELNVNLEKKADLKLDGKTDDSVYNLEDNASLDAKKLKARKVILNSKNRSDIYVHATKSIAIQAEGKSKIFLYGNPEVEIKGFTDKSSIIKK